MFRASLAILASAVLLGLYARGGIAAPLGFVALVPWLASLATLPSWRAVLASGIAMAMLFSLAVFAWFGDAVAAYTGIGTVGGVALVVLAAPLMQPQFVVAALAARWAAKEAVAKAFGTGIGNVQWKDIEILRGPNREPVLHLHGYAKDLAEKEGLTTWSLSLSHTEVYAVATAVAIGET